jgi:hypothetical protein
LDALDAISWTGEMGAVVMRPEQAAALTQGLVAGLIGYSVFVIYFAGANTLAGDSPFHTASVLGAALFSLDGGGSVAASVIAYNGLHLIASLAMGLIASFLVLEVDLHPNLWYVVMFLFIAGLLYAVGLGGIVANEIAGAVTWLQVVVVNVVAAVLSGWYLWRSHPRLKDRVRRVAD